MTPSSFTKHQMSLAVSCALALGVVAGVARAEAEPAQTVHVAEQRNAVAKSGYELCWQDDFGPAPPSAVECDPKVVPEPVAKLVKPAAQPAEVPAAAPNAAAEEATLEADARFDFDNAVPRPAGRLALDDLAGSVKDVNPETITAVGHTDRVGAEGYNQSLSEQRVAAVKSYLVSRRFAPNRAQSEGKGEMPPVTQAGDCEGAKSAEVIACLQPERRVEIGVVGSRIVSR